MLPTTRKQTCSVLSFEIAPPVDAVEEPNGIIVSYGADEEPVSVEFLDASERGLTSGGELSVTLQTGARQVTPS
jgi:hypothetical protein